MHRSREKRGPSTLHPPHSLSRKSRASYTAFSPFFLFSSLSPSVLWAPYSVCVSCPLLSPGRKRKREGPAFWARVRRRDISRIYYYYYCTRTALPTVPIFFLSRHSPLPLSGEKSLPRSLSPCFKVAGRGLPPPLSLILRESF